MLKEGVEWDDAHVLAHQIAIEGLLELGILKGDKDEILKERDVKLGYMSAFAKASTLALKEIPAANASIEGSEIVYRDYVDLSVAVATPKGLVTPVLRNAESLTMVEIEKEIASLGKKVRHLDQSDSTLSLLTYALQARDGKLTIEDMAGGTFTM